jgi:hypothetical protein
MKIVEGLPGEYAEGGGLAGRGRRSPAEAGWESGCRCWGPPLESGGKSRSAEDRPRAVQISEIKSQISEFRYQRSNFTFQSSDITSSDFRDQISEVRFQISDFRFQSSDLSV